MSSANRASTAGDSQAEAKALEYTDAAKKLLRSPSGMLGALFGVGSSKVDQAIELYCRAANEFKKAKNWYAAGTAFCDAAKLHAKQKVRHEVAHCLIEAANCYRKVDIKQAVTCWTDAIQIFVDLGKWSIAARHEFTCAELLEAESQLDAALHHYEKACEYYSGEAAASNANKCRSHMAHILGQQGNFDRAATIFEALGRAYMENKLLIYGAKEHFFKATICLLAVDAITAKIAFERFEDFYPAFADSREYKLAKKLIECCESSDIDGFSQSVAEFERVMRLDKFTTKIVEKIKSQLEGQTMSLR